MAASHGPAGNHKGKGVDASRVRRSARAMIMRGVVLVGVLILTGCPGALLLSALGHDGQKGYVHPPNAKDYASWEGEPKAGLETHSQFAHLPRDVRAISDGSELWTLRYCPNKSTVGCCLYEFVLRAAVVTSYRTAGTCGVDCSMRPESKVQACINDTVVPDDYGRSK